MFGTGKKIIWHLGLARSPGNFLGPLKENMAIVYFYMNLFSFCEKVPSALDHADFFSKYFTAPHPPTQMIFFNVLY